ncbi:MAG: hypothetical protein EBZ48_16715 [Proteobacteria bacterium]|nr:hypothetical protein [Pseudomonadota bacterium]
MNSESCSSSLRITWQLLPWGFAAQYDLQSKLSPGQLRTAAKILLTSVLPQSARSQETILDLRGRDPLRESLLHPSPLPAAQHEELLYLSGSRPIAADTAIGDEEPLHETFELAYRTHFSHFEGARHIAYAVERSRRGAEQFNGRELELLLDPGTTLNGIRLGLEVFEPRFLSIFGFSPIATQLLQIEALPQSFSLRICGEALRKRDALPLKSPTQFNTVAALLKELFDFDLMRDYQNALALRR